MGLSGAGAGVRGRGAARVSTTPPCSHPHHRTHPNHKATQQQSRTVQSNERLAWEVEMDCQKDGLMDDRPGLSAPEALAHTKKKTSRWVSNNNNGTWQAATEPIPPGSPANGQPTPSGYCHALRPVWRTAKLIKLLKETPLRPSPQRPYDAAHKALLPYPPGAFRPTDELL
ncbi:MAG: hypothetical protein IPL78_05695 [Chloroflexi bacterium]|nr:hypothetical protein [Chloroflexota bacterium]